MLSCYNKYFDLLTSFDLYSQILTSFENAMFFFSLDCCYLFHGWFLKPIFLCVSSSSSPFFVFIIPSSVVPLFISVYHLFRLWSRKSVPIRFRPSKPPENNWNWFYMFGLKSLNVRWSHSPFWRIDNVAIRPTCCKKVVFYSHGLASTTTKRSPFVQTFQ